MTVQTVSDEQVTHALLNSESVEALAFAKENPGQWVVWQSGFAHHRASKTQAYNLRQGKRQKTLTRGLLDEDGDERLEFVARAIPSEPDPAAFPKAYVVLARYTTAEYRVREREGHVE